MAINFIRNITEYDYGSGLLASEIRYNLLKQIMYDGIQIASGTALAIYSSKFSFPSISTLMFSTIGAAGAVGFCVNIRKYFQRIPNLQRGGIGPKWYLTTGTLAYLANVYTFSEALMRSHEMWIPCAAVAGFGYCLAVSSMNSLGRTVLNRMPLLKGPQLMFGPALIAGGAYYLLGIRQHEEDLLFVLPWAISAIVGNHITFFGYRRVQRNDEPNWLLFKGIELLLGGCIMCINGAVLIAYSMNKGYHAIFSIFYLFIFLNGTCDISNSFKVFKEYADLESPVFNCMCGMATWPVMFVSSCLGVKFIQNPIVVPLLVFVAGTSLALLTQSVLDLYIFLPRQMFFRCSWRVLGIVMTMFGSLGTVYTGYHFGWRSSLLAMLLIPMGVYVSYRGYTNIDELE